MRQPHANYRLVPVDEHWNRTHAYDDLRHIQKSFHRFYGDIFTRILCTKVLPSTTSSPRARKPSTVCSRDFASVLKDDSSMRLLTFL